ncbi:UMP kinase [Clostridium aminobutyricum]|uniref:Uridylate kinase n=1 Tax=Clostridium aminobutyricum TaxID=33953 RepID=A0A939D6Q3_CLOAM|nr:UMP kinase [Clostridium aminobutyricum]MBN7772125.1 UMP kinase [Clostridium aminobutyricum]
MKPRYKRVLIKVSGEALAGPDKFGISDEMLSGIAAQIKEIHELGVQIAIVVGGGNFWRGRTGQSIDRATADYMGMLATTMNAMALQDAFEKQGLPAAVQTAISMTQIAEPYNRKKAISHLEAGKVVIFGTGTGSPFFSTDTTSALRAAEIDADVILLAKKVDAVYSADPEVDPNAIKYDQLAHKEVIEKQLGVMDITAATLCMENNIAIHVFGVSEKGNMLKAINGEKIGTIVR